MQNFTLFRSMPSHGPSKCRAVCTFEYIEKVFRFVPRSNKVLIFWLLHLVLPSLIQFSLHLRQSEHLLHNSAAPGRNQTCIGRILDVVKEFTVAFLRVNGLGTFKQVLPFKKTLYPLQNFRRSGTAFRQSACTNEGNRGIRFESPMNYQSADPSVRSSRGIISRRGDGRKIAIVTPHVGDCES